MSDRQSETIRRKVRECYGEVAVRNAPFTCAPSALGCCGLKAEPAPTASALLGYSEDDLQSLPEGADMGLGCGNPQVIAALGPGDVVLDLGSGGGFDCFLAAQQVGESGRVIGVDMTPEMVSKARENARSIEHRNVEFRLGEIEHLPVADGSVDVILSNCVINLSPDKSSVFRDAFRVLKTGGRLAISDVVATAEMPTEIREHLEHYAGCVAGAATLTELRHMLADNGFTQIQIQTNEASRDFIRDWAPGTKIEDYVVAATIEAIKPPAD